MTCSTADAMSCAGQLDKAFAGVLIAISLALSGCDFGTSQNRHSCSGGACDCQNNYYGMEAGVYLAGVPVEHASFHLTIPRVEPDKENSTGCCDALYDLHPVHLPRKGPSRTSQQAFCNKCAKAPNAEISEAAKKCGSATHSVRSVPPPKAAQKATSSDEPMDGSDAYSDCKVEIDGVSVPLGHAANVSGIVSNFNIKWTDVKRSTDKACCAAISPVLRSLYFGSGTPSQSNLQAFCDACKTAYNPGVGLAAFRWCGAAASMNGSNQTGSALGTNAPAIGLLA